MPQHARAATRAAPDCVDVLIREHVSQPESFVAADAGVRQRALDAAKQLFEALKTSETKAFGVLPCLYTDGLDTEQVYQQLELQSAPHLAWLERRLGRLSDRAEDVQLDLGELDEDEDEDEDEGEDEEEVENDDDDEEEEDEDEDDENERVIDEDEDDAVFEPHVGATSTAASAAASKDGDRFFSRAAMEAFVREAEEQQAAQQERGFARAQRPASRRGEDEDDEDDEDGFGNEDGEDDEDPDLDDDSIPGPFSNGRAPRASTSALQDADEDVDLFAALDSDDEDEDDDDEDEDDDEDDMAVRRGKRRVDASEVRYSDFFDPPPAAGMGGEDDYIAPEREDEDEEDLDVFGDGDGDEEDEYIDPDAEDEDEVLGAGEDSDSDTGVIANRPKLGKDSTSHQQRSAAIGAMIDELEATAMAKKPWLLRGEASSRQRPKDSLLEAELEFAHNAKVQSVPTEADTDALEEMIRQRVLAQRWDDVVRKHDVASAAGAEAGEDELPEVSGDKSKQSLAEVYEQEYLKRAGMMASQESTVDVEKREIAGEMKKLFHKLDQLSNFYFTPRPVIRELSVRANAPALQMEEVVPAVASDAQLLAPQDIQASQRNPRAEAESTQADRRKDRRARKRAGKRARDAAATAAVPAPGAETGESGALLSKADAVAHLAKAAPRNVTLAPRTNAPGAVRYTKSGEFFSRLADDAATSAARKQQRRNAPVGTAAGTDEPDAKRRRQASSLKL